MSQSHNKLSSNQVRMEVLEKRVLYSADPVFGVFLDVHQLERNDHDVAAAEKADHLADQLDEAEPGTKASELVIVDITHTDLDSLHASLVNTFSGSNTMVVSIDGSSDALAQLSTILAQHSNLDAIHLLSHGQDGTLALGGEAITQKDLLAQSAIVEKWGEALSAEGDVLLYGCNLSTTESGKQFASTLSTLMRADVASSDDITGHSSLGGDWDLEIEFGTLETAELNTSAPLDDWTGALDFTSDLVAHWKMNGNTIDSVGPANAIADASLTYTTGQIADGINLPFSSTAVDPPHLVVPEATAPDFLGGEFTLGFWVRPDTITSSTLFEQSDGNSGYKVEMNAAGRIAFKIIQPGGSALVVSASNLMTAQEWNHVALTYAANEVRVTVNGVQKSQSISSSNLIDAPTDLYMGHNSDGTKPFHGALDDVRLYTRALTFSDIIELMDHDGSGGTNSNTEEQLTNNTGFSLANGGIETVSSDNLSTIDTEQTDAQLIYTVNSSVSGITLSLNGLSLAINDTFTQQDINDGIVSIAHSGQAASTGNIQLSVDDGFGTATSLLVSVAAPANAAPTDIVIVDSVEDTSLSINDPTGNNAYFTMNQAADALGGLDSFTYEIRFEASSTNPPDTTLFTYGDNVADKQLDIVLLQSNGLIVSIAGQSWLLNSAEALSLMDGDEHALALSWDSSTGETHAYVDGQLIGSTTLAAGLTLSTTGTAAIGNDLDAATKASFAGQFYDMRLFSAVRTPTQIEQSIDTPLGLNEPNLVGYWTFDSQSTPGSVDSEVGVHHLLAATSMQPGAVPGVAQLTAISVYENTANGTVIGKVHGIDPERQALLAQILSNTPNLVYSESAGIFLQTGAGRVDWDTAYAAAAGMTINGVTGHLAMPNSAAENTLLLNAINDQALGRTWLSAHDSAVEGEYRIIEPGKPDAQFADALGNPVNGSYVNWNPGEPNAQTNDEDYIEIWNLNGMWNDVKADKTNGNFFFAEFNANEVLNGPNSASGINRSLSYSLASQTIPNAFAIDTTTGEISINDTSLIDYESLQSHTLTIEIVDDAGNTYSENVVINIKDADEISTHTHPSSVSLAEDSSINFNLADAIPVSIQNPDTNQPVTLTLSASSGLLSLSQTNNLTVTGGGNATNAASIQVSGLVNDLNQALDNLTYSPNPNFAGLDSITIESVSTAELNNPLALVQSSSIDVEVTEVNDAPIAANDSAITNEAGLLVLQILANDSDADLDDLSVLSVSNPLNGTAVINPDNSLTYLHDGTETVSDVISYVVSDGRGGTATAMVTINVTPVNDSPVAVADNLVVNEGANASLDLLSNDSDAENSALSVSIITAPANGNLTANPDGTYTYLHDGSETTADTFSYQAIDQQGAASAITAVSISVIPENDAPIAVNDGITLLEGSAKVVPVLNNDSDAELDTLSVQIVSMPSNGSASVNSDNTITYTHSGDLTSTDSLTYSISDGNGGTSTATLLIAITPVNDTPVAAPDSLSINEGASGSIDLLANDSDEESTNLQSTIVNPPANGSLIQNADGTYLYTHNGSETTSDSFTYQVTDPQGASSSTTPVSVDITAVNDAPVASTDSINISESDSIAINVLSNDSDAENDNLQLSINTPPVNGSVSLNTDGTIQYTHNGSNTVSDSFSYSVDDGNGGLDIAIVSINILPFNDRPVATDDLFTLDEATSANFAILQNDTDPEGDTISASIVTAPAFGTVTLNNDGTATYTHDGSENSTDSFTYTVSDLGGKTSNIATALITINPINDAPVAINDGITLEEGSIKIVPVLQNDTDNEQDNLSVQIIAAPVNGLAVVNADNSISYTHDGSETTSDELTYTINDGNGGTDTAKLLIGVTPVNDAPVAINDSFSLTEGTGATVDLLSNDFDAENTSLVGNIVSFPSNGALNQNTDGTFFYVHDGTETTSDTFTYNVVDNNGASSNIVSVQITISPVNDAPMASNDAQTVLENGTVTIHVLDNDSDAELDNLSVQLISVPSFGTAIVNTDNSVSYTHDGSENYTDTFAYTASDGSGSFDNASVTINVTPVNDNPIANDDSITLNEGETSTIDALVNDADSEGNITLVGVVQSPINGTVVINNDGTFNYTHDASQTSSDSFVYQIVDADGETATATISVLINNLNDAPIAVDDELSIDEGSAANINVLGNDSDEESNTFQPSITINPQHGTVVINADNTFTYIHDGSENHTDSFVYTIFDDNAAAASATVNITVTTVNDNAPVITNLPLMLQISENAANGTLVGIVEASDTDIGDTINFALSNDSNARFTISTAGEVQVLDGSRLNHEQNNQHSIDIVVTDAAGNATNQSAIVQVIDAPEPITQLTITNPISVPENASTSAVIGIVSAVATDDSGAILYSLQDDFNGLFALDPNTGELSLSSESVLDYESQNTYNLTAIAIDATGANVARNFIVSVVDVNEAPIIIAPTQALSVSEQAANGFSVGTVIAEDPENNDLSFNIVSGNQTNIFNIDSVTGEISIANAALLDFESISQHVLNVEVADSDGALDLRSIVVNVTNVNEAPELTTSNQIPVFIENAEPILVSEFASISDVDSANLVKVELRITNYQPLEDQLHVETAPDISHEFNSETGTLVLTGPAPVAQFNDVLQQLKYSNGSENPNTAARQFELVIYDANNSVTKQLGQIAVVESNDRASGSPVIVGTPQLGEQLYADHSSLADADGIAMYFYQWMRDGIDIVGATDQFFTVTSADAGHDISVKVSLMDANDRIEPWFDSNVVSIAALEPGPEPTPPPTPEPELQAALPATSDRIEFPSLNQNSIADVISPANTNFDTIANATASTTDNASSTEDKIISAMVEQGIEQANETSADTGSQIIQDNLFNFNSIKLDAIVDATDVLALNSTTEQLQIKTINRNINLDEAEAEEQLASLLLLEPIQLAVDESNRLAWQTDNLGFRNSLDKLSDNFKRLIEEKQTGSATSIEALIGISIGVTSGFLIWLLRGGALLASMLSVSPIWKHFDPLPIVNSMDEENSSTDAQDGDVEQLFDKD